MDILADPAALVVPRDTAEVEGSQACPVCSETSTIERYTVREMFFGTRSAFRYRRCAACGVLWLEQPPADLSPYYPGSYHTARVAKAAGRGPFASAARWLDNELATRRLFGGRLVGAMIGRAFGRRPAPDVMAIRPMVRAARLRSFQDPILDVGCGPVPERLLQLSRVGFRALTGIDPMIDADTIVEGIPVRRLTIHEVRGSHALITFNHSFEHVRDPGATLAAAARLLRPGGAIVVRTPVMGGWFWETYGTSWWELDPPRHLFVHTRRSLEILGEAAGLDLVRVDSDSTFLEILASDQITRDIPWRDPASCWNDLAAPSLAPAVAAAKATVARLNAEGRGGRASFLFRARSSPLLYPTDTP